MSQSSLGDIAAHIGGELIGDPAFVVSRIGPPDGADPTTITFIANPKYQSQLETTSAGCVIVGPALRDAAVARGATIVVADAYLGFARLTQFWAARTRPKPAVGVHPSAVVDPSVRLGADVSIGPLTVIEADAVIGDGVIVGAHGFIGRGSSLGAGTRFASGVTFNHECHIGERGIIHSGVVIGADGFGFAPGPEGAVKIEQLGGVRIGHDVEIGANTCIDRGALEDTVIGNGVKIDNQVQIGHNVRIGDHTAIAGCVGIAGSAVIGSRCLLLGASMIVGHLTIADGVTVSAATAVTHSIRRAGTYSGMFPFDDNASWEKNAATLRNLYALRERVRALEKKLSSS